MKTILVEKRTVNPPAQRPKDAWRDSLLFYGVARGALWVRSRYLLHGLALDT